MFRGWTTPVHINSVHLRQKDVKYLGLHLDRRLAWRKHIFEKRNQLGMTLTKMHWLLGRRSKLFTSNNILIYRTILRPIWAYEIHNTPSAYQLQLSATEHSYTRQSHSHSHNRPSAYQLQRSATEHSSACKSHSHKLQQA
jgi:hypothetical protein